MSILAQFGIFSDAHYANGIIGERYSSDSPSKLHDCISILNRKKIPVAFNMGDLVDRLETDLPGTEKTYLQQILPVVCRFNGKIHHVLGNHDAKGMTKQEFREVVDLEPHPPFYSTTIGNVHCIILDGNFNEDFSDFSPLKNIWENAWFPPNEMSWLKNELKQAKKSPVIIFIHENCDNRSENGVLNPHILRNAGVLRKVLESYGNVMGVIQGHYHPGMTTVINGIPYLGITAMATGPGTENNAFAIVSLHDDGTIDVSGFGRQPSLTLRKEK